MLGLGLNIFTLAIRRYFGGGGGQFAGSSLNLDFTSGNQSIDPRITFTRASTATRVNASGVLESVAIDGPRFDYDPVTLAPKGLLIEEQRTNLLTFSEQINGTDWGAPAGGTVAVDQSVAPDGTTTADHFTQTIAGNILRKTVPLTNGTLYTASVYVRSVSGNTTFVTDIGDVGTNVFTLTTQWQRISFSAIATAVGHVDFRINGAGTFAIWGAQLEAGAFPTSYIPTTTAAATRAADVAVMTGANFSNWYNATTGAVFVDYATMQQTGFSSIVSASDGTNTNRIQMSHVSAGRRPVATSGGVAQWDTTGGVLGSTSSGVFAKFALAYEAANYAAVVNGGTPATQTSGTIPSGLNRLAVGADGASGNFINGHIRRLAFIPRRLSNSELIGLTS